MTALVGANGAGKSTLLMLAAGLRQPTAGAAAGRAAVRNGPGGAGGDHAGAHGRGRRDRGDRGAVLARGRGTGRRVRPPAAARPGRRATRW
ncbi:ATP-binding cassette domain-containing protein [Saccharothrix deserti]|uniref:ATP-binding cassette domain-containing protein n=1 Tax=Saccharothrix deserti TaxID=2593674 RepID=UPI002368BAA7|nr:ATP-binding cassette domain-containing protein [Saccharothrix deserti]